MVEWDLKSMDRLAGTIANPDSKHYGKFDLGPAGDAATYDQVNALWAMIQN